MGLPARCVSDSILHAATGIAVIAVGAAIIAGALGVATWIATLIATGVIAVAIVVAASYALRRPKESSEARTRSTASMWWGRRG